MKFLAYEENNIEKFGILKDEKVYPLKQFGIEIKLMEEIFSIWNEKLKNQIEKQILSADYIKYNNLKKCSPIKYPKQDIICLGINYAAHAEESARYKKEAFGGDRPKPIYFSKRVNKAVADLENVDGHFDIVDSLDYEVELAVIIGEDAYNVSKENAEKYIFGYTILNDISARNLQTEHKQWYFGKSLDNFTPIGPCIVTKDEISYPPELNIKSYVNGELRQNSNTKFLITSISDVIEELSKGMTLKKGTIIAMGTPDGVGMGFEPPKFLNKGDIIICEIEKIGNITNAII